MINLPEDVNDFLDQLIKACPRDYTTFRKIASLGKIRYSYADSLFGSPVTAAVLNTVPYTLILGAKFLEKNANNIYDCVYILFHELTHIVLDHFAKDITKELENCGIKSQSAKNIIFDCQVNATCYHSLKEEKYLNFVKSYYSKTKMPSCFFRPDGEPEKTELKKLHKKLYSINGITNKELIEGLLPWFKENEEGLEEFIKQLLGNHGNVGEGEGCDGEQSKKDGSKSSLAGAFAKDLKEALEDTIDKMLREGKLSEKEAEEVRKKLNQSGKQAGKGGQTILKEIEVFLDKLNSSRKLGEKLNTLHSVSPSSKLSKAIDAFFPKQQTRTPIPNFYDRRTVSLYSIGHTPIFHNKKEYGHKYIVPCYLDVSGSQDHVVPFVIPVVARLKRKIGNIVYCFSTEVYETKIKQLELGKYKTTGGTCFNGIAESILANKYQRAIILTDGCASMKDSLMRKLKAKGVIIKVCWTVPNPSFEPLASIAKETFYLFSEDQYDRATRGS